MAPDAVVSQFLAFVEDESSARVARDIRDDLQVAVGQRPGRHVNLALRDRAPQVAEKQ